ncbi:MAG: sugar transferase [Deltaproteobacteria bacterium]|nr:sugar transferase [Deltaproteobacteria bacterium]
MTSHHRGWRWLLAAADLTAGLAAFLFAFQTRIHLPLPFTLSLLPPDRLSFFATEWWVVAVSQPLVLYFFGFYDPPDPGTRGDLSRRLGTAVILQGLLLMGYFFLTNGTFPRSILLLFALFNYLMLLGWRHWALRLRHQEARRVAIVGCGSAARSLARTIRDHGWHELEVAGFVPAPDEAETPQPKDADLGPCLGSVEDLPALLQAGQIDDLILAANSYGWQTRLMDGLTATGRTRGSVLLLPGPFESLIGRMRYRWVRDLPLIEVVRQSEWRVNRPVKRTVDLVGGSLLLLGTLPLIALCALVIRLTSPGPAFFRQERLGAGRKPFELWKLRTMQQDAERHTGEVLAEPNDPRLTPVGGMLRRFRIDELPQLFNVLKGEMSLVGPRPERPVFVERFLDEIPGYSERFSLPPGLTGLAQISGEYHSTAENKLRFDLAYLANWSLWLDLSILLRTVKIVLTLRGT